MNIDKQREINKELEDLIREHKNDAQSASPKQQIIEFRADYDFNSRSDIVF